MNPWSVQDAEAQLSELMRRARGDEPQQIGTPEPCIVIWEASWLEVRQQSAGLGDWLVSSAPRGRRTGIAGTPFPPNRSDGLTATRTMRDHLLDTNVISELVRPRGSLLSGVPRSALGCPGQEAFTGDVVAG